MELFSLEFSQKLVYSLLFLLGAIALAYSIYSIVRPKLDTPRRRQRFRYRLAYILILLFLFFSLRLWFSDFEHIFTIFGLVAAGLVVACKESLMNMVGFFVINWRNLFAEGDQISILNYNGYVDSIGPLYFKIYELDVESNSLNGHSIRIPNGLLITNPVVNYSAANHWMQISMAVPVSLDSSFPAAQEKIIQIIQEILKKQYGKLPLTEAMLWRRYHKDFAHLVAEEPIVRYALATDRAAMNLTLYVYCLGVDQALIKNLFWQQLIVCVQQEQSFKLVTAGG